MTAPCTEVVEILLRIPPTEIAFLKFVFESYEGIAVVRTVDRKAAVIVLIVPRDQESEARRILSGLRDEVAWEEMAGVPAASDA